MEQLVPVALTQIKRDDALVTYAQRILPEMQAKFVKDCIKRAPEVQGTKSFVSWGVKFAEVLR